MSPARKQTGLRDVRVGLLILVSLTVLILLLLNASGDISPFSRKLNLKARFPSADGLRAGAEVQLAGVRIGSVKEVHLLDPADSPTGRGVEALLAVDETIDELPANQRIRTDSRAQLGTLSLLAPDRTVNITPGTTLGEPVPENFLLESTAANTIADLTASGKDLTDQLNKLSVEITDIARKVNEGEGSLGRLVNDEGIYNNVNLAIRDTQELIRQIRTGQGTAGRLLNDPALYENLNNTVARLQGIADDLRAGRGTAGKLLTDDAVYDETRATISEARNGITRLNTSLDEINVIIADVRAGRGSAGKLLTDEALYNDARAAIARFNTTAERVDTVVAGIQRGEGTAGKLITDEQLYNNVNQLSAESVKLLYDFRQNPRKYLTVQFKLF
jgi:phospholipid/cholesterol/gamma-HCH transport system substrate-binding protein